MIEFLLNMPLYFYEGLVYIWWGLGSVIPHYSWHEYGELLKGFAWLIPARVAYGVLFPEKVIIKRLRGRTILTRKRGFKPSKTDHQTAAAAIFETITHH
jgi:hypothetical protein